MGQGSPLPGPESAAIGPVGAGVLYVGVNRGCGCERVGWCRCECGCGGTLTSWGLQGICLGVHVCGGGAGVGVGRLGVGLGLGLGLGLGVGVGVGVRVWTWV